MDKCEICGKDWGLLGIVTKADTGEVVTACGSCSEEELRKDLERRLLRVGDHKTAEKRRGKAA